MFHNSPFSPAKSHRISRFENGDNEATHMTSFLHPQITSTPLVSPHSNRRRPLLLASRKFVGPGKYALSTNGTNNSMYNSPNKNQPGPLLASTPYNVNVSTYLDSKSPGLASRIVQYKNEQQIHTHQEKYDGPGLFPIVHLFKKDPPILSPKSKNVTVRIGTPEINRNYSQEHNRLLLEGIINSSSKEKNQNDVSTRSVLDALKEISRKRIHSNEGFDLIDPTKKSRQDCMSSESTVNKRGRIDSQSSSETSSSPGGASQPKRVCYIDPITASRTSSLMYLKESREGRQKLHQKLQEVEDPINRKYFNNAETQTLTAKQENKSENTVEVTESKSEKKKETSEDVSFEKPKHFEEKSLEVIKKNRLFAMVNALTSEEMPRIPSDFRRKTTESNMESPSGDHPHSILSPQNKTFKPKKHVSFDLPAMSDSNESNIMSTSSSTSTNNITSNANVMASGDSLKPPMPILTISSGKDTQQESNKSVSTTSASFSFGTIITTSSTQPKVSFFSTPANTSTIETSKPAAVGGFKFDLGAPVPVNMTAPIGVTTENKPTFTFGSTSSQSSANNESKPEKTIQAPLSSSETIKSAFGPFAPKLDQGSSINSNVTNNGTIQSITPTASVSKPSFSFGAATTTSGLGLGSPSFSFTGTPQTTSVASVNFSTPSTVPSFGTEIKPPETPKSIIGTSNNTFLSNAISTSTTFNPLQNKPMMFGASSTNNLGTSVTTSALSPFNAPTTMTSSFGNSTTPSFGNPTTTPSFGTSITSASSFSAPTTISSFGTSIAASSFGTTATTASSFGTPATTVSSFGTPTTTASFGTPTTTASFGTPITTASFGTPITTASTSGMFGNNTGFGTNFGTTTTANSFFTNTPNTFGKSTTSAVTKSGFGNPSSTFGQTSNPVVTSTPSMFGNSSSMFGTTTSTVSTGFNFSATKPAFGNTNNGFGTTPISSVSTAGFSSKTNTNSTFGANTNFGGTNSTPAFGVPVTTPMFGATTTTASGFGFANNTSNFNAVKDDKPFGGSTFGSTTNQPFGTSNFGTTAPFGQSSSNGFGVTTTASSGFGSTAPTFGTASSSFPSTTANNTFGNTPSIFGGSSGFNTATTSTPSIFGTNNTTGFGAPSADPFGASNPTSTFANNNFGSAPSTFGNVNQTSAPFGTPNVTPFGANNNNAPSNTFGNGFSTTPSPFGNNNTASTFGSPAQSSAFPSSNAPTNGVFTFGSPAPQTNNNGVFSFGAADPSKTFNFSANNNTGNVPAFGATNPPAGGFGVPNTFGQPNAGQANMFSIGSGAQSRGRAQLRAKRRT